MPLLVVLNSWYKTLDVFDGKEVPQQADKMLETGANAWFVPCQKVCVVCSNFCSSFGWPVKVFLIGLHMMCFVNLK